MDLLGYPKTDYLLDTTLQSLHEQSVAWVKELGFRADEMALFYRLLRNHKLSKAFPPSQVAEIEKQIVDLNGTMLDRLKAGVTGHERLLAKVYGSTALSDGQPYREAHKRLGGEMNKMDTEIRKLKTRVFALMHDDLPY